MDIFTSFIVVFITHNPNREIPELETCECLSSWHGPLRCLSTRSHLPPSPAPHPHSKPVVLLGAPLCRLSPSALELSWTDPNLSQRSFQLRKETWSRSVAEFVNVSCGSPIYGHVDKLVWEKESREQGRPLVPVLVPGQNVPSPSSTPALPTAWGAASSLPLSSTSSGSQAL